MALRVPEEFQAVLSAVDAAQAPFNELSLAGQLASAVPQERELSSEERRGAFAESGALWFQPAHSDERRERWGTYWTELTSVTNPDGSEVLSPDIADVNDDVLAHWIARSES